MSGHADMQNPQEPEKQKGLKYYVTLCSLMIQQAHSIQAPEVFSVCQTNKALFIKVVSKQQLFSASRTRDKETTVFPHEAVAKV